MITEMAVRFWTMGIQASILIGVVLATRFCLKKYPKIYSYCLWALVGIRLLCPFWVESVLSLLPDFSLSRYQDLAQENTALPQDFSNIQFLQQAGDIEPEITGNSIEDKSVQQIQQQYNYATEKQMQSQPNKQLAENTIEKQDLSINQKDIFESAAVWVNTGGYRQLAIPYIIIICCFLLFYGIQYLRMKHKVATAVRVHDNIWLSADISSPFVMGVFAPQIYMPYWVYNNDADNIGYTYKTRSNTNMGDLGSSDFEKRERDNCITPNRVDNNLDVYQSTSLNIVSDIGAAENTVSQSTTFDTKHPISRFLTCEEYQYILTHEQTHIRHFDPIIRIIGMVCVCLHWWNPLVWLAVSKMNEDMEMFCDETVVLHFTAQVQQNMDTKTNKTEFRNASTKASKPELRNAKAEKTEFRNVNITTGKIALGNANTEAEKTTLTNTIAKEYASALLSFAEKQSSFYTGLAFGKSYTEKRIRNILQKRKKSWVIAGFVMLLAVFCVAALMTVPKRKQIQDAVITEWSWNEENLPYLMEVCSHIPDFASMEALDTAFWEDYLFYMYTSDFDKESENIFSEQYDFEIPYNKVAYQEIEETTEQIFGKKLSEYIEAPMTLGQDNNNIFYREGYFYISASDSPDFHYTLEGIQQVGIMTEVSLLKTVEDNEPVSHVTLNLYPAENTRGFRIGSKLETQVESETQMTPFAYIGYNGYLDECTDWTGYNAFVNQDYDGDGLPDRVLRTCQEDAEYCQYQIVFGNGAVLQLDREVYDNGTPRIESADINGDGENEIVFSLQYGMSTDMRGFGDLAVFEKKGNAYQRAELPFDESNEGYRQELLVHYQKDREQFITVSLEAMDYKTRVPIQNELWDNFQYKDYYQNTSETSVVWDSFLVKDERGTKLACKVHLFDKWSEYGLIILLCYENQRYIIEEVMPAHNEFMDSLPDTRETWQLKDYRLCAKDITLANGEPAVIELWLKEGEYVTGEDVLPSAQTYPENYQGQYILITKDKTGAELDRHELNQPNAAPAERDTFGDRCNFSGSFEIQEADYNGDHCPDFTIGVSQSSSMNFFVLYTVRESGKIELLCKEGIPAMTDDFSVQFEMEQEGGNIISYEYDNSIAEQKKRMYIWDLEEGIYRSSGT